MLTADHPLAGLQAEAAVASGWPTLHLFTEDEAGMVAALDRVRGALGPLPQADLIEPWEPVGEPWELRIDLPGFSPEHWAEISAALPEAVLVPGLRPGVRAAEDRGERLVDEIEGGGLVAELFYDAVRGGVLTPDLARPSGAEDLRPLEEELAEVLRSVQPDLRFVSDRGADTVQPVVHRSTGRFGVAFTCLRSSSTRSTASRCSSCDAPWSRPSPRWCTAGLGPRCGSRPT